MVLINAYVAVNFLSQVIFLFLLFLGMVMHTNKVETKESYKITRDKKIAATFILLLKSICRVKTQFSLSPMNN